MCNIQHAHYKHIIATFHTYNFIWRIKVDRKSDVASSQQKASQHENAPILPLGDKVANVKSIINSLSEKLHNRSNSNLKNILKKPDIPRIVEQSAAGLKKTDIPRIVEQNGDGQSLGEERAKAQEEIVLTKPKIVYSLGDKDKLNTRPVEKLDSLVVSGAS